MGKLIVELPEELHAQLKRQAAADRKTLKTIVISLLGHYLQGPTPVRVKRTTGLCGAWKDRRSASALIADGRSAREWWTRSRP